MWAGAHLVECAERGVAALAFAGVDSGRDLVEDHGDCRRYQSERDDR